MEINNIQIKMNTPYPQIVGASNNPRTVMILKDLLSARSGEVASVMQYFYQSILARNIEPEIADILQEISIVEMGHMEILMQTIVAFGGVPKYDNGHGQLFTSNYINYSTKLKDMLDANIVSEQQAINNYSNAVKMVDNQSLKNLLNRIIEDEQLHLNTFNTLRNRVEFLSI